MWRPGFPAGWLPLPFPLRRHDNLSMHIEPLAPRHHEFLIDLLCELHGHYNDGASIARESVRSHLFDKLLAADSPLRLVVACDGDDKVIGFAALSLVWSLVEPDIDKRRQCQLKELYVSASARGRGAGEALMSWVARYAAQHGCGRIDWPVKASNARGIAFYERLGARLVEERLSYRLSGQALAALAETGVAGAQAAPLAAPEQVDACGVTPMIRHEFATIESARATRDGGIDAVAALDAALPAALAGLPVERATALKHLFGNLMGEVIDQMIQPAVRSFPELAPDESTWQAVAGERARIRSTRTT